MSTTAELPCVFFVVSGDPRLSDRVAEAVRIAAGVAAWRKVAISIYFRGAAVLALGEFADELVEGDAFVRYLPILGELEAPVFLDRESEELPNLGTPVLRAEPIDIPRFSELCRHATYLLRL